MSDLKLFWLTNGSVEAFVGRQVKLEKVYHGTGDLELTIKNLEDIEKAKPLIQKSFDEN